MTQMYINSILLSLSLIGLVLIGNVRAAPSEQLQVVLKYHMGPVLSNNKTVHLIWYGSWSSGEKRIIRAFISSLSASEPLAVGGAVVESSRKLHGPNWFESDLVSHSGTGEERPVVPRWKIHPSGRAICD
ncbi:putative protein EXORDIUM [Helianthus annuus]|nr:putative protein EXORDIUM [Helianthus annuus]